MATDEGHQTPEARTRPVPTGGPAAVGPTGPRWTREELGEVWTLGPDEHALLAGKRGATRLGFAVTLRFFAREGRFPAPGEIDEDAVEYVASQVDVAGSEYRAYDHHGRTAEYHRSQIRDALGFRPATIGDAEELASWLLEEVAPQEYDAVRLKEAAYARLRALKIEPPTPGRVDRLRFIDERLAPDHQVIHTTHSPFMVDATRFEKVRTVEDTDGEGTKIGADVLAVGSDTRFPLQAALGYQLSQTLFVAPDNLIVEGPSDIVYLQVLSSHLRSLGRTGLDDRWAIVPAGGMDKIPALVSLFGSQLNLAVILDVGSRGNQRVDSLVTRGILEPTKLFPLTEITGSIEADVEDLFGVGFYLNLLRESGVAQVEESELPPGPRLLKRLDQHMGRFDHYRPAVHLQREQGVLLPGLGADALDRFESLFEKVNGALE